MKDFLLFPDRLRLQMKERGVNNAQLAKAIGVSHVAVGNFLNGQLPKSEHLFELARFFGVPMEYFLAAEGEGRRMARQVTNTAAYLMESAYVSPGEKQHLFNALSENLATLETAARSLRELLGQLGVSTAEPHLYAKRASTGGTRASSGASAEDAKLLNALAASEPAPVPKSSRSRATGAPTAPASAPSRAASPASKGRPVPPKRAPAGPAT